MFGDRPSAAQSEPTNAWAPRVCVLGKLPTRRDFLHYGLHQAPEQVFRSWLEHAVLLAGGVLPNRAVRFIVAPLRTPMIGVWVPSHDAAGSAFPLVFLRRLPPRKTASMARDAAGALREVPWTLLLATSAHYLAAAESCLLLGRSDSVADIWCRLEALPLPAPADVSELWSEARRAFASEPLEAFAYRSLSQPATGSEFTNAVRRLGPDVRVRADGSDAQCKSLALPAQNEFDLFAWLELLNAQRAPEATPKALFWSAADRRALVSLGAPLPGTVAFLRQPRQQSVQRLPAISDPDDCPALDAELKALIAGCSTLAQLRAALVGESGDVSDCEAPKTVATDRLADRKPPAAPQPGAPIEASRSDEALPSRAATPTARPSPNAGPAAKRAHAAETVTILDGAVELAAARERHEHRERVRISTAVTIVDVETPVRAGRERDSAGCTAADRCNPSWSSARAEPGLREKPASSCARRSEPLRRSGSRPRSDIPTAWLEEERLPEAAEAFMPPPLRSRSSC